MIKTTLLAMIIVTTAMTSTANTSTQQIMNGTYYDYMAIELADGSIWILDDSEPTNNPYMVYDAVCGEYVSRFSDGDTVQVLFDTMGTDDLTDDVILGVWSL